MKIDFMRYYLLLKSNGLENLQTKKKIAKFPKRKLKLYRYIKRVFCDSHILKFKVTELKCCSVCLLIIPNNISFSL